MKKRQWAIIIGLAILAASFLLKSVLSDAEQNKTTKKPRIAQGVEVFTIDNDTVTVYLRVDGSLQARQKIALFAEVNGIMQTTGKAFEEGVEFSRGETILQLENSEAEAAYESAKSQYISALTQTLPDIKLDYPEHFEHWQNYLDKVTQTGRIPAPKRPDDDKLRLFLTARGIYQNYQNLRSARVRLNKFTIKAPFSGVITEAMVEEGTLVRPGMQLGEFIAPGTFDLVATLSSQEINLVNIGDSVHLRSTDIDGEWTGLVYRKNAKVDPTTLRVKIFIKVKGQRLSDGMFMAGRIRGRQIPQAEKISRNLIFNQNELYVVRDSVLKSVKLEIMHKTADFVVARGLENGTKVPANQVPGAYDGMPVKIINP